jgi:hypothetical protein
MTRTLIGAVMAASLALALLAPGASAARNCGGGVTVTGAVDCGKAKRIVKEFIRTRKTNLQGYKCSGRGSGGRLSVVNCRQQEKLIHWKDPASAGYSRALQ